MPTIVTQHRKAVSDTGFERALGQAQEGADWALAVLYRQLQPSLLGYLRAQHAVEAEDLASETWIAVARGLKTFRGGEDDFRRWVFTIARRRVVDLARADRRRPTVVSDAIADTGGRYDLEGEALSSAATREALELVARLPSGEAEVVFLRVIAELSVADVAAITGRSAVGVRVTQHRALRRLQGLLSTLLVTLQSRWAM